MISSSSDSKITPVENAASREYSQENAPLPSGKSGGVTLRISLLCIALAFLFGSIIPIIDRRFANTFLGALQLPPGAIMVLLVLLLVVNPLLRVLGKRWSLSRNEMLVAYICSWFACLIPGHGGENWIVPIMVGPFYFATRENGWLQLFQQHLKPWMTPAFHADGTLNRPLFETWYTGLSGNQQIPWAQWLMPLFIWSTFIVAAYFMLACLSVMLRAQWGEKEALAFPLLRLPLEMTRDVKENDPRVLGSFFRSPTMWCGFALAAFVQSVNSLNLYFPQVPAIPLSINSAPLLTETPWNQMGWASFEISLLAVGIAFLLTSEVSFSLWFFFWVGKFQLIFAYWFGYLPSTLPTPIGAVSVWDEKTFNLYQQVGAYIIYFVLPMWTARKHLGHIARRAFGRAASTRTEKTEAMSYPAAFWGFFLALAFMCAWGVCAGIDARLSLAMWLCYLVMCTVLTRIVVESGMLFVLSNWTPLGTMGQLFGAGPGTWMSHSTGLLPAAFAQTTVATDIRGFLMPSFMQGFKLAHDQGIRARRLLPLIFAVIIVTLATALWMNVRLGYEGGALQLANGWFASAGAGHSQIMRNVNDLQNGARDQSWMNWTWVAVGSLVTYGLILCRSRFAGFPLHPIGYIICLSYPVYKFWLSILIGWACKVLITRFGGVDVYRKAIPFFLGLALGDVAMMLLWLAIDCWQGRQFHQLMPG